jgi:hypothetical protein
MKDEDSTDSYNILPNKVALLPLEIQSIEGVLDQIRFRIDVKINASVLVGVAVVYRNVNENMR